MGEQVIFSTKTTLTHGRGYVYSLQYHLVWCTKYRAQVLESSVREDAISHLHKTAEALQIRILAVEIMPDHIHMLISCKPQCCLADAVKVFKGNTARWLFMTHPELKKRLWGGHLWNPGYYVETVSDKSEDRIRQYIETQTRR